MTFNRNNRLSTKVKQAKFTRAENHILFGRRINRIHSVYKRWERLKEAIERT